MILAEQITNKSRLKLHKAVTHAVSTIQRTRCKDPDELVKAKMKNEVRVLLTDPESLMIRTVASPLLEAGISVEAIDAFPPPDNKEFTVPFTAWPSPATASSTPTKLSLP